MASGQVESLLPLGAGSLLRIVEPNAKLFDSTSPDSVQSILLSHSIDPSNVLDDDLDSKVDDLALSIKEELLDGRRALPVDDTLMLKILGTSLAPWVPDEEKKAFEERIDLMARNVAREEVVAEYQKEREALEAKASELRRGATLDSFGVTSTQIHLWDTLNLGLSHFESAGSSVVSSNSNTGRRLQENVMLRRRLRDAVGDPSELNLSEVREVVSALRATHRSQGGPTDFQIEYQRESSVRFAWQSYWRRQQYNLLIALHAAELDSEAVTVVVDTAEYPSLWVRVFSALGFMSNRREPELRLEDVSYQRDREEGPCLFSEDEQKKYDEAIRYFKRKEEEGAAAQALQKIDRFNALRRASIYEVKHSSMTACVSPHIFSRHTASTLCRQNQMLSEWIGLSSNAIRDLASMQRLSFRQRALNFVYHIRNAWNTVWGSPKRFRIIRAVSKTDHDRAVNKIKGEQFFRLSQQLGLLESQVLRLRMIERTCSLSDDVEAHLHEEMSELGLDQQRVRVSRQDMQSDKLDSATLVRLKVDVMEFAKSPLVRSNPSVAARARRLVSQVESSVCFAVPSHLNRFESALSQEPVFLFVSYQLKDVYRQQVNVSEEDVWENINIDGEQIDRLIRHQSLFISGFASYRRLPSRCRQDNNIQGMLVARYEHFRGYCRALMLEGISQLKNRLMHDERGLDTLKRVFQAQITGLNRLASFEILDSQDSGVSLEVPEIDLGCLMLEAIRDRLFSNRLTAQELASLKLRLIQLYDQQLELLPKTSVALNRFVEQYYSLINLCDLARGQASFEVSKNVCEEVCCLFDEDAAIRQAFYYEEYIKPAIESSSHGLDVATCQAALTLNPDDASRFIAFQEEAIFSKGFFIIDRLLGRLSAEPGFLDELRRGDRVSLYSEINACMPSADVDSSATSLAQKLDDDIELTSKPRLKSLAVALYCAHAYIDRSDLVFEDLPYEFRESLKNPQFVLTQLSIATFFNADAKPESLDRFRREFEFLQYISFLQDAGHLQENSGFNAGFSWLQEYVDKALLPYFQTIDDFKLVSLFNALLPIIVQDVLRVRPYLLRRLGAVLMQPSDVSELDLQLIRFYARKFPSLKAELFLSLQSSFKTAVIRDGMLQENVWALMEEFYGDDGLDIAVTVILESESLAFLNEHFFQFMVDRAESSSEFLGDFHHRLISYALHEQNLSWFFTYKAVAGDALIRDHLTAETVELLRQRARDVATLSRVDLELMILADDVGVMMEYVTSILIYINAQSNKVACLSEAYIFLLEDRVSVVHHDLKSYEVYQEELEALLESCFSMSFDLASSTIVIDENLLKLILKTGNSALEAMLRDKIAAAYLTLSIDARLNFGFDYLSGLFRELSPYPIFQKSLAQQLFVESVDMYDPYLIDDPSSISLLTTKPEVAAYEAYLDACHDQLCERRGALLGLQLLLSPNYKVAESAAINLSSYGMYGRCFVKYLADYVKDEARLFSLTKDQLFTIISIFQFATAQWQIDLSDELERLSVYKSARVGFEVLCACDFKMSEVAIDSPMMLLHSAMLSIKLWTNEQSVSVALQLNALLFYIQSHLQSLLHKLFTATTDEAAAELVLQIDLLQSSDLFRQDLIRSDLSGLNESLSREIEYFNGYLRWFNDALVHVGYQEHYAALQSVKRWLDDVSFKLDESFIFAFAYIARFLDASSQAVIQRQLDEKESESLEQAAMLGYMKGLLHDQARSDGELFVEAEQYTLFLQAYAQPETFLGSVTELGFQLFWLPRLQDDADRAISLLSKESLDLTAVFSLFERLVVINRRFDVTALNDLVAGIKSKINSLLSAQQYLVQFAECKFVEPLFSLIYSGEELRQRLSSVENSIRASEISHMAWPKFIDSLTGAKDEYIEALRNPARDFSRALLAKLKELCLKLKSGKFHDNHNQLVASLSIYAMYDLTGELNDVMPQKVTKLPRTKRDGAKKEGVYLNKTLTFISTALSTLSSQICVEFLKRFQTYLCHVSSVRSEEASELLDDMMSGNKSAEFLVQKLHLPVKEHKNNSVKILQFIALVQVYGAIKRRSLDACIGDSITLKLNFLLGVSSLMQKSLAVFKASGVASRKYVSMLTFLDDELMKFVSDYKAEVKKSPATESYASMFSASSRVPNEFQAAHERLQSLTA